MIIHNRKVWVFYFLWIMKSAWVNIFLSGFPEPFFFSFCLNVHLSIYMLVKYRVLCKCFKETSTGFPLHYSISKHHLCRGRLWKAQFFFIYICTHFCLWFYRAKKFMGGVVCTYLVANGVWCLCFFCLAE